MIDDEVFELVRRGELPSDSEANRLPIQADKPSDMLPLSHTEELPPGAALLDREGLFVDESEVFGGLIAPGECG